MPIFCLSVDESFVIKMCVAQRQAYVLRNASSFERHRECTYTNLDSTVSGFGGLEVACWPLVPKFVGSNPAEAVGFFRAKKSSARLPSEGK